MAKYLEMSATVNVDVSAMMQRIIRAAEPPKDPPAEEKTEKEEAKDDNHA